MTAAKRVPPITQPSAEGEQQAADRPVEEGAVDPADDRVLDQVGREALLVAALGVDEEPAHVGVEEAAQRRRSSRGHGRRGGCAGRPLRRRRRGACGGRRPRRSPGPRSPPSRGSPSRPCSQGLALKARWVRWRWKPTVIPSPVKRYRPTKRKTSLQCSASPQTCQAAKARATKGTSVTRPVMIRSRVSLATGWMSEGRGPALLSMRGRLYAPRMKPATNRAAENMLGAMAFCKHSAAAPRDRGADPRAAVHGRVLGRDPAAATDRATAARPSTCARRAPRPTCCGRRASSASAAPTSAARSRSTTWTR